MTALLSGVVLVLIICHAPKTIINIYESYQVRSYFTNPTRLDPTLLILPG